MDIKFIKSEKTNTFYIPESTAGSFSDLLTRHNIPHTLKAYGDLSQKEKDEAGEFLLPPFELNIKVKRLSKIEANLELDSMEDGFYNWICSEEYQAELDRESKAALEDDKDFNQPGIWVNTTK